MTMHIPGFLLSKRQGINAWVERLIYTMPLRAIWDGDRLIPVVFSKRNKATFIMN